MIQTPTVSIVIATRNRPDDLRDCLNSLLGQTQSVTEVIIVDSSDNETTRTVTELVWPFTVRYIQSSKRSAAIQRNIGSEAACGDYLLFLDDDVILKSECVARLLRAFTHSLDVPVGGVSAFIENQFYTEPSLLNRLFLFPLTGTLRPQLAGKVVGPGLNYLPADGLNECQRVDWLPSCGVMYPRALFLKHLFQPYQGYSFSEDVELSSRIGQHHTLLNATGARLFHKDQGGSTHKDWFRLGEMMILHRHALMVGALKRRSLLCYLQLFYCEIVYGTLTFIWSRPRGASLSRCLEVLAGRLAGAAKIVAGRPLVHR